MFQASLRAALVVCVSFSMACGPGEESDEVEDVGEVTEGLAAFCSAKVQGVGKVPVETKYLARVVHCENGGAQFEALKAQAIAARTYLYYKLETSGSIADGQSDQVFSCGSGPTDLQIKAVKETAGQVLRHGGLTLASFYVAGDPTLKKPGCKGQDSDAATEHFVTYNKGLTGNDVHPSSLGSSSNPRNRGCKSQWGARCLAHSGKSAEQILRFYYGADVNIVTAKGACIPGDDDNDGVFDGDDNCKTVKNPGQVDTDHDGKGDKCDGDDDDDGIKDGQDNCRLTKNPGQLDTDGDGRGDKCDGDDDGDGRADKKDNCPLVANKGQKDTDHDGKGDKCDGDDDGDGVPDSADNCRLEKNPGQLDTDGDGKGDKCEADDDGDQVIDTLDNCPKVANDDQEDSDGDGKGDACDADDDGDGVLDAADNCDETPNPDQADADSDGAGDACQADPDEDGVPQAEDNCPEFENPDQVDEDGDGVGDACADGDGDGIPDVTDDCPDVANADQADADENGVGDACEV